MLRYCLPALFAVLFFSCLSEPDCVVTASSKVKIALEKTSSDSARLVKFDRIEVLGTDSVFYVDDTVSVVVLPINTGSYQTTFRFFYESKTDSIVVAYSRTTRVISPACGIFNYYQDLAIILSTFPSAVVANPQLSTSDATNLTVKL